ncbi:MAG: 4Fe-4S dicluster domain-containing protein [Bacillota bacterium]
MKEITEILRREAARLLKEGIEFFIGYAAGSIPVSARPFFAARPEEVDDLVFNTFCVHNLVKYLIRYPNKRVAVVVKGCDNGAVSRLVQERHLDRTKITVVGVPCGGMIDRNRVLAELPPAARIEAVEDRQNALVIRTGQGEHVFEKKLYVMAKCQVCAKNNPASVDIMLGKEAPPVADPERDPFKEVKEIEALEAAGKAAYWERLIRRCLRCYACRQVCPACSCTECSFEQAVPGWQQGAMWLTKAKTLPDNFHYHLIRAFHVAGRCAGCAECERVCPVGIPLMLLNNKLTKDIKELFGEAPADACGVLCTYSPADPDEFA